MLTVQPGMYHQSYERERPALEPGTAEHHQRVTALRKVLYHRERIEQALPGCAILPPALSGSDYWEFRSDHLDEPVKFHSGEQLVTTVNGWFPGCAILPPGEK